MKRLDRDFWNEVAGFWIGRRLGLRKSGLNALAFQPTPAWRLFPNPPDVPE
jgi:hypothetical protein